MTQAYSGRVQELNDARGFGFIAQDGRSRRFFFHFKTLQKCGIVKLPIGARVEFTTIDTDRGEQVDKVLSVDTADIAAVTAPGEWIGCCVKWFNREAGYGFLVAFDRGGDIFIHMDTVRASGFFGLHTDQRLRARCIQTPRGLLAVEIDEPEATS
jgi:CspA family cold shock protein